MCNKWICVALFIVVFSLAFASGTKAADPNLVGWWPLNEGIGETAIDLSGSGSDGTINNLDGGLGVDGSVWVEDPERGIVLSFNGDDSAGAYVVAGSIPAMDLTTDFTWIVWCKQDDGGTGVNEVMLGNRYGGTADPLQFVKFTPTKFEYYNADTSYSDSITYPTPIPDGVWVHNAAVKQGATLTYYRDGVEVLSATLTKTMDANPFYMGGDPQGERWRGCLSDVRTYNRALTKLDVLAVMAGVEQVDMEIGAAVEPPVIDGEVDYMWESASTQYIVALDDPANASGSWKALYDAENLYVIVDITDDSLANDSAGAWQDDSVEFYFDGGNSKDGAPLSGDNHQYTFGWATDEVQGTNMQIEGVEQAQVDTDTGWRIEIKLPWSSLQDAMPQARDLIGIDCFYNDDDDGGDSREGQIFTFATDGSAWNDASQWGTAILAAIPEPVDPGADGLVAFYALENNTDDSSDNGLHGVIIGAPSYVEGPAGYGMALEFDGESYVDCGSDDLLNLTEASSMSIWMRPGTDGSVETAPLAKADSVAGWSWQLRYGWNTDKPTIMGFQFNGTDGRAWVYVNEELPADEWCHVGGAYDGTTVRCYLDGVETDSAPMAGIVGGASTLLIGSDGWRSDWIGAIDEVAIYNRGLSSSEMRYLAGFRADAGDASLSIHYTFDEVGDVVADQSGNGHDGVVVGDVTAEANGMVNGAANFANGGYLDLDGPNVAAEDIPTSAMTLAAWIKLANTGGDHEIFSARASDGSWLIHPEPKSSGDIRWLLRSYGGTTIFQIRAGTVTWDQWLHFAGTYDKESGKAALYINGELIEELDVENPADIAGDWDQGARVGLTIDNGRPFTGLMDEFRMYTRALSQEEVVDIMAGM